MNTSALKTFPINTAITRFLRYTITAGYLALAGSTTRGLGTAESNMRSDEDAATLRLWNSEGTRTGVASGAIAAQGVCYAAASGKIAGSGTLRVGIAITAATADGDYFEWLPDTLSDGVDGAINGPLVFDTDFFGDYPAAGSAFAAPWTKVETNGIGITSVASANGNLSFVFDAVNEAATAALYMASLPFDVDDSPIFECRLAIYDIGDNAALDFNFGLASGTHATDFDSVSQYAAFHLDGTDLSVKCRSKDGTTTVADTDTTIDLVDDTFATFKIDATDKSNVKFYINGSQVLTSTTFTLAAYTSRLTPIVHVEKTADDTTMELRLDRIRVSCKRN
jgi:hypothetical protein